MDTVQILMSTYNGEKYLDEQIKSIIEQEEVKVKILIRDDGSTDRTIDILEKWSKNNNIEYYKGENLGPAKSFMELVRKTGDYDYYAFADQDDVWNSKKIISAINKIKNSKKPTLYISALEIVDENLCFRQMTKINTNLTFESELIKNFATGCTEVFNKKLRDLLKIYNPKFIMMHDSWICRVCYALGGNVVVDNMSYIKYRQHSNNVLGYKDSGLKKIKKQFKVAFKDKVNIRVNIARELKKGYEKNLIPENVQVIDKIIDYKKNFRAKLWLIFSKKFKTNNYKIDLKMIIAIVLNKF